MGGGNGKINFIKAGTSNQFPPSGSPIRLSAAFLPDYKKNIAEEQIKLIATRKHEKLLSLGFNEGMLKVYDSRSTGIISDLVKRLNRIDPDKWTETTALYTITR